MTFNPGKKSPDYKALFEEDKRKNLAALSLLYEALPGNFRRTLAEAARIKDDRRGLALVELTEDGNIHATEKGRTMLQRHGVDVSGMELRRSPYGYSKLANS